MSYKINFTNTNKPPITVENLSLNSSETSLVFVGKNYPGYAQFIGENFLHLLENFASSAEPSNPIEGQLWYDTAASQIKIRNSARKWVEVGGIKKTSTAPVSAEPGDLWVNPATQQLYLYNTSSNWVLVGPQFNEAATTSIQAEQIINRATESPVNVISVVVDNLRVAMFSTQEFTPKLMYPGFGTIKQGITLSSEGFNGTSASNTKLWGTAEKAEYLVIGNSTVAASNFLRSDVTSTTDFPLNVRNSSGISIGASLDANISSTSQGLILTQRTGGSIFLNPAPTSGASSSTVVVTPEKRVGINKLAPEVELDVSGSVKVTGTIETGTLTVSGTSKLSRLEISSDSVVKQKLVLGNSLADPMVILEPESTDKYSIGSLTKRFNSFYAKEVNTSALTVDGTLTVTSGNKIVADINGSAMSLANSSSFAIDGEVLSQPAVFTGAGQTIVFNAEVGKVFFSRKPRINTPLGNDRLVLYRPSSPSEPEGPASSAGTALGSYVQTSVSDLLVQFGKQVEESAKVATSLANPSTFAISGELTSSVSTFTGAGQDITFDATVGNIFLSGKQRTSFPVSNDRILIYRPSSPTEPEGSAATPATSQGTYLQTSIADLVASTSGVPAGAVMAFANSVPPIGWLECNGAELSSSAYPSLFSAIGTTFGTGTLPGTFKLPDLRAQFVRGWDHGRGVDAGRTFGSSQQDELKAHSHTLVGNNRGEFTGQPTAPGLWEDAAEYPATDSNTISETGGSETRPKNIALMYCIKF